MSLENKDLNNVVATVGLVKALSDDLRTTGFDNGDPIVAEGTAGEVLRGKVDKEEGKRLITSAEASKLTAIEAGAEVNQNAYSSITVGETPLSAGSKTDSITFEAGARIILTPSSVNGKKITIAAADQSYGLATTSTDGLMSASDKTKIDGMIPETNIATLVDGKVPESQLPSYVDDVVEGYYDSSTQKFYKDAEKQQAYENAQDVGESGKIYVDITEVNSSPKNDIYRWAGTTARYIKIASPIVVGTASGNAYDGADGAALAAKIGNTSIGESGTTVTGAIASLQTSVSGINDSIGNSSMGTTATTLTGAIAELKTGKADVSALNDYVLYTDLIASADYSEVLGSNGGGE